MTDEEQTPENGGEGIQDQHVQKLVDTIVEETYELRAIEDELAEADGLSDDDVEVIRRRIESATNEIADATRPIILRGSGQFDGEGRTLPDREGHGATAPLADALDGLQTAEKYCETIGHDDLAYDIAGLYQRVGRAAPDEHWKGG